MQYARKYASQRDTTIDIFVKLPGLPNAEALVGP